MKASNQFIWALSAWFWASAAAAVGPSTAGTNLEDRIRIQQERLPQIEQMARQEREQVQQWYERRRSETPEEARELAARLGLAQRLRWIEYARMYADRPSTVDYFDSPYFSYPFSERAIWLPYALVQEFTVSEMADLLRSESFRAKLLQVEGEHWQLPVLRREARRLLDLMDTLNVELTMSVRQLERNRTARLDEVAQREKGLQEQVRIILDYLKQSAERPPQLGVVEAVGYNPQTGYYCMIEGVDRVLQPGDTVRGIRVVSIDAQEVAFARNGTTWTQGLGAAAQPHWD
jgi:hypothetical protein